MRCKDECVSLLGGGCWNVFWYFARQKSKGFLVLLVTNNNKPTYAV